MSARLATFEPSLLGLHVAVFSLYPPGSSSVCICPNCLFLEDTHWIRVHTHPNQFFRDPVSKYSPIPRYWVRMSIHEFGGDTIQPITFPSRYGFHQCGVSIGCLTQNLTPASSLPPPCCPAWYLVAFSCSGEINPGLPSLVIPRRN
jgi:hypothetical protein